MTATTIINNRRSSSYNNDDGDGEVYYIPTNNEEQQQQYNNNNNNNNNDYDDLSTTTTIEKEEEEKVVLTNVAVVIDTNNNEDELDDACHRLIQQLDDTQKEQAARYSYKYFVQSESLSGNTTSRQQQQLLYAKKMARNHIIAENGNINKALNRLKETLVFRQEIIQIDNMRKCFNPLYKYNNNNDDDVDDYDDDDDDDGPMTSNEVILPYEELRQGYNPLYKCTKTNKYNKDAVVDDDDDDDVLPYEELRHGLYDHMGDNDKPRAIIQGYDKDGRAIYLIKMHNYKYFCLPKFYNHLHYYLLDRALAATEERTNGKQSKIMVIFDYSLPQYNNNRRNSKNNIIPYNVAKTFIHNFERYWPETCYKIILLDTPFLFRGASFWTTMIKPLLDPNTKEKIVFLNDGYDKEATLRKLIDKSQASPIMLINGQMKRKFDKSEFFERTPYNHIFNE